MVYSNTKSNFYKGVLLAIITTIIWSGNFIIARGVFKQIPPISLAFFRWSLASVFIFFIGIKHFRREWPAVWQNRKYLFWVAFSGITLFNTFIYVAGHYTSAINLALIGTTSSPVFAILISAIFLKEAITPLRILGLVLCISGILVLLSGGSLKSLLALRFSVGDVWILCSALAFAIYTVLVRRKPSSVSPQTFLFTIFITGSLLLLPGFVFEQLTQLPIQWNAQLAGSIFYLGAGASVIAYFCWNAAIARIGSVRTALFGNLIPVFSTLEAVWLLNEQVTIVHFYSGLLVIAGLIIANSRKASSPKLQASL